MIRTLVIALPLIGLVLPTANAQDWARKLFKVTEHDFSRARKAIRNYRAPLESWEMIKLLNTFH